MADDWEDWENDEFTPVVNIVRPVASQDAAATSASAVPDKFKGEDADFDAEANKPVKKGPTQPKKETLADRLKSSTKGEVTQDQPLDDPIAEKLRQQKLVEESDFRNAQELFGDMPDTKLEDLLPKAAKDFEEYAELLYEKYLAPHSASKHYKQLVKSVIKHALGPLTSQEAKDVETAAAGVRADKAKAELAAKKDTKKKSLNVGKAGGMSAGLDDYAYDTPLDDDYDFM